jgi:hypothetical protein
MRFKKQVTGKNDGSLLCVVLLTVIAVGALAFELKGQSGSNTKKMAVAEAEKRIGAHISHIEKRVGEMVAAFYYEGAKKTLEDSFKKRGITKAMGYADSWGKMGIGLTWSESAKEFYAYHLNALTESLRAIRSQGYAHESDLDYLDRGMGVWKEHEAEFPKRFAMFVDLFTKQALIFDEQSAYMEKYYAARSDLEKVSPYPASKIDALNSESYATSKGFDDRMKRVESTELQKVRDEIVKMGREHLFSAINEGARVETGSAIGANELEGP